MRDSTPNYPRGTPYRAPPEPTGSAPKAPRTDEHLRAWALKLAIGTVAMVAVLVTAGVVVAVRMLRPPVPVAASPERPETLPGPSEPLQQPRIESAISSAPSLPATQPRSGSAPEKEAAAPRSAPSRDDLLDAVGSLLGAHLHQGYLNIGLLADAQENDAYEPADAKKVLGNVLALLDNVDQQIRRLAKNSLDDDDRKRLAQATAISALLRLQAKELGAYWDTPEKDKDVKKDHETKYLQAREQAWTGIKALLDIKE